MAPFILAFQIQCMLDYDVVCSCYDERNGRIQTIEHDIEMSINIRLLNIPSW
jgi:hypothetical protein